MRCENELFGNEVNIAFQLGEDIANKDEILLTESAYNVLKDYKGYDLKFYKKVKYTGFTEDSYEVNYKV